jgi:nitrogen fixation protein NifX
MIADTEEAEVLKLDAVSPDDKVLAKLQLLQNCSAVFAASIGRSSIRRLMEKGIQPVIVNNGERIGDILNQISHAMQFGGIPWVEKALSIKSEDRFSGMLE